MTERPADDIAPDTKDWTWVLTRPCTDCGFDPRAVDAGEIGEAMRAALRPWPAILERADARRRPGPRTWSPLEYGCHLRDVCRVFEGRLRAIDAEDDPVFADWDQDAAAVEADYRHADPRAVSADLVRSGEALASAFAALTPAQLDRPGRRSDGAGFTAATLGTYALHELVHHTWDARPAGERARI